jgi:dynein heavy chain 1
MRTLLSQCIYGGKVDNDFDQRLLESFLDKIFSEKCFEPEHPLVQSSKIVMPEGVRRDQFLAWIEQLADKQVYPFPLLMK